MCSTWVDSLISLMLYCYSIFILKVIVYDIFHLKKIDMGTN